MKVVIIGIAGHVNLALAGLKQYPDAVLAGIAPGSKDEDISGFIENNKQDFPDMEVYDNYLEMLDKVKPDVACVSPFFYLHSAISQEVMQRGIHCFCEKPVALTLDDLADLKKVYEQSEVEFTAMLEFRYNPGMHAVYKAVKDGMIGVPLIITAQKSYKMGTRPEFFKKRSAYGGTIPWVGAHSIDLIYWCAGSGLKTVFANQTILGNQEHGELESSAVCCFTFADGGQGSTNIDYFRPQAAPTHGDNRLRAAGDKGVIEIMDGKVILITNESGPRELTLEPQRCFFKEFLDQVQGKGKCLVSADDAFKVTEICLKARQSADEGKIIEL